MGEKALQIPGVEFGKRPARAELVQLPEIAAVSVERVFRKPALHPEVVQKLLRLRVPRRRRSPIPCGSFFRARLRRTQFSRSGTHGWLPPRPPPPKPNRSASARSASRIGSHSRGAKSRMENQKTRPPAAVASSVVAASPQPPLPKRSPANRASSHAVPPVAAATGRARRPALATSENNALARDRPDGSAPSLGVSRTASNPAENQATETVASGRPR